MLVIQIIQTIFISQLEIPKNDVKIVYKTLYIYSLKLKGKFILDTGDFLEFNAYLKNEYPLYIDNNGIYFLNRHAPFILEMDDPELQYINHQFQTVFNSKYHYYLEENSKIYFNNLFS